MTDRTITCDAPSGSDNRGCFLKGGSLNYRFRSVCKGDWSGSLVDRLQRFGTILRVVDVHHRFDL